MFSRIVPLGKILLSGRRNRKRNPVKFRFSELLRRQRLRLVDERHSNSQRVRALLVRERLVLHRMTALAASRVHSECGGHFRRHLAAAVLG